MKTLYLVRHAKSDWGNENLKDIDRPLNQRGYNDAYLLSKQFAKEQAHPELIITSTATRAYSTCTIFARALNYKEENILLVPQIYEAPVDSILSSIATIDDKTNSLMVFGHNPGFTNTFNEISDSDIDDLPTCGILGIKFDIKSWNEIYTKRGKAFLSLFPKNFRDS